MTSLLQIISLAAVDAINPCALAVMLIVLMSILLYNPQNKKKVLYGGLAFTLAVFILYFLYGLIMIQLFSHLIPNIGIYSYYVFKAFGVFAIILGILNLKDYLSYSPGSFMTEMPLKLRPKMKLLVKQVTSVKGAFIIGILVTFFLLPCTIGPYIIASGQLSVLNFLKTIPLLLLYNLVFVIPMILITLVVYFGLGKIEDISNWKDKNIKKIHLVEAIILILLGIAMITGLI